MIFSDNRVSTHRVKPEGMLFRDMLYSAFANSGCALSRAVLSR
jgi:hypothetical protein